MLFLINDVIFQLTYLQDIQITLDDTLDQLEAGIYRCKDKCLATATSLFEQVLLILQ